MTDINPKITVINTYTKEVTTHDRDDPKVKLDLQFGTAYETEPEDPKWAAKWRAEIRDHCVAEWKAKELRTNRKYLAGQEPWPVFEDYEAWCEKADVRAFPAEVETVVRWLLSRCADGGIEAHRARRCASVIGTVHDFTRHPPKMLAKQAFDAFHRAHGFAKAQLGQERVPLLRIAPMVAGKAWDMFPDGVVPRHFHEIAA